MFTQRSIMNLKADAVSPGPARGTEGRIIPLFRGRKAHSGDAASITADNPSADGDLDREKEEEAGAKRRGGFQKGLKSSADVIVALPMVGTFEAFDSKLHKIAA